MQMVRVVLLLLAISAGALAAPFGNAYPILGEFSDIVLDEARQVLYLPNFTASRIEVFSLANRTVQAPIRIGINPSAAALSPDGRILLILNFGAASLFLLDLETRAVQTIALPAVPGNIPNLPRAGAYGSDGAALILTTLQVVKYDPATGLVTVLGNAAMPVLGQLPVPPPNFPAEIVNARMAVSRDRNTIFAVGSFSVEVHFAFYYTVSSRTFTSRCASTVSHPVRFASISPDASLFMGGPVLFDRGLRVLADFTPSGQLPLKSAPAVPTAPPPNTPPPSPEMVIGGSEFSRDGGTVYSSLITAVGAPRAAPFLYVLDSDNLTIRDRILIPERLIGKMISNSSGSHLFALSEGGLTILPIGELNSAPLLAGSTDTLSFRFNVCNRLLSNLTFDVTNRGDGSLNFTVSTDMPGLRLSASSGSTPARITATFDPAALANIRGTTVGQIRITSEEAVNQADPIRVLANLQDTDQRGTIFVQGGQLRDVLVDEPRERFYILDSQYNRLLVYNLNDFSLRRTVRTGHFPLHMNMSRDRSTLLVANAQSETISIINLDTLDSQGFAFCPCSSYPRSIAVSSNAILVTTAVDRGQTLRTADNQAVQVIVTEGRMNRLDLASRTATELATMGIFENSLSPKSLLTATPSGSRILIAEDSGKGGGLAKVYEADSDTFVVARAISERALKGSAAANDGGFYNAGAVLMGSSLMPLAEFRDTPNEHNGLVFMGAEMVRTLRPEQGGGPGLMARVDPVALRSIRPVKLVEAPLELIRDQPLRRSLAANGDFSKFITLSSSGFVMVTGSFDAFIRPPVISAITNSASFAEPVAPGALISVFGENLAPLTTRAGVLPLPTFLSDSCMTVNNLPIPLIFLSPGQINGQLPFEISGSATAMVHTPGGVSDPFTFQAPAAAPALFRSTFGGQADPAIPMIFRALNSEPVTVTNPVRRGEVIYMFGNGFGRVTPLLASGAAAPATTLFSTLLTPTVTIGGRAATVLFSGLVPGLVGLNQLNVRVPDDTPLGFNIPLQITAAGVSTETFLVRVLPQLEQ